MDDDWNRKSDKENIGHDVSNAHSEQLCVTLSASWPGVRVNLPIVGKRLTLCKGRDEHGSEGDYKKDANPTQAPLVASPPEALCQAL
jgi:hypothetical protein